MKHKYTPNKCKMVLHYLMTCEVPTKKNAAKHLRIPLSTFNDWYRKFPDFKLVVDKALANTPDGVVVSMIAQYKPEMCDTAIEIMGQGLSKNALAGELKISSETLYKWIKRHPHFAEAVKIRNKLSQLLREKIGRDATLGEIKGFREATYSLNMNNRFKWGTRNTEMGDPENPIRTSIKVEFVDEDKSEEEK